MAHKGNKAQTVDMPVFETKSELKFTKDQAGNVSVGDKISVMVSGEVIGIRQTFDDKNKFTVEIKNPQHSNIKTNSADRELKKLKGK